MGQPSKKKNLTHIIGQGLELYISYLNISDVHVLLNQTRDKGNKIPVLIIFNRL